MKRAIGIDLRTLKTVETDEAKAAAKEKVIKAIKEGIPPTVEGALRDDNDISMAIDVAMDLGQQFSAELTMLMVTQPNKQHTFRATIPPIAVLLRAHKTIDEITSGEATPEKLNEALDAVQKLLGLANDEARATTRRTAKNEPEVIYDATQKPGKA